VRNARFDVTDPAPGSPGDQSMEPPA
jgi:hypothetical protein